MSLRVSSTVMDKTISTSSYAMSGVTAAGGMLSLNNIALLAGIVFALLTFLVNLWYQHRKDRLAHKQAKHDTEYHRARMARLNDAEESEEEADTPEAQHDDS